MQPSDHPTSQPSVQPSHQPRSLPTSLPTLPTSQPSKAPTLQPLNHPTSQPSSRPTGRPTPEALCYRGSYYINIGHSSGYPEVTGYFLCIPCSAGYYSDNIHQSVCKACPKGSFSKQNSTECTLCALNFYSETDGTETCKRCKTTEVNGQTGSTLQADCVNTSINFVMGSIALVVVLLAVVFYLWFGRLHQIAFQRKFRLVRKCIVMFGAVLITADMINHAGIILDKIIHDQTNKKSNFHKFYKKFIQPILFVFFSVLTIAVVTVLFFVQTSARIIFNSMGIECHMSRGSNISSGETSTSALRL